MKHVKSSGRRVLLPEIQTSMKPSSTVYSDEWKTYSKLPQYGYPHETVNHSQHQYTVGWVHTQNIENFWSNMKRGIEGVYRHVDAQYLQAYADDYAFRYSHRKSPSMFWALMCRVDKA